MPITIRRFGLQGYSKADLASLTTESCNPGHEETLRLMQLKYSAKQIAIKWLHSGIFEDPAKNPSTISLVTRGQADGILATANLAAASRLRHDKICNRYFIRSFSSSRHWIIIHKHGEIQALPALYSFPQGLNPGQRVNSGLKLIRDL